MDTKLLIQLDDMTAGDQLEVLEYYFRKFDLKTISDYAREKGIERQTVYNRIKSELLGEIELGGVKFVFEP